MRKILSNKKGMALIFALGILALLFTIAIPFALNARLELKAAANFSDEIKAKYLAEAGINRAIAELRALAKTKFDYSDGDVAINGQEQSLGDGTYKVVIKDEQRKININNASQLLLENLLEVKGVSASAEKAGAIVTYRTAHPFRTIEEIKLVEGIGQGVFNDIKDSITVHSYVDSKTVNPQFIISEPRAPVNVNTVSLDVLKAVLKNISDGNKSLTDVEAEALAVHLIDERPFKTWRQLYKSLMFAEPAHTCPYCRGSGDFPPSDPWHIGDCPYPTCNDGDFRYPGTTQDLGADGTVGRDGHIGIGDADLVMANANPNTGLSRYIRNVTWQLTVGKEGKDLLTNNTTEFSFNSGGIYEIESKGEILDESSNVVGEKKIRAILKVYDTWHQTNQADFDGSEGNLGIKNHVETYPDTTDKTASLYDGQIKLATVGPTEPNSGSQQFLAAIEGSLNANYAASGDTLPMVSSTADGNSSIAGGGDLFPDGVLMLSSEDKKLTYNAKNNINTGQGTIEFWMKPAYYSKNMQPTQSVRKSIVIKNTDFDQSVDPWGMGGTEPPNGGFLIFSWSDPADQDSGVGYIQCLIAGEPPERETEEIYPVTAPFDDNEEDNPYSTLITMSRTADADVFCPGEWHHIGLTWDWDDSWIDDETNPNWDKGVCKTGRVVLYIDGVERHFIDENGGGATQFHNGDLPWEEYSKGFHRKPLDFITYTPDTDDIDYDAICFGHDDDKPGEQADAILSGLQIFNYPKTKEQIESDFSIARYYNPIGSEAYFVSPKYLCSDESAVDWGTITWTENFLPYYSDSAWNGGNSLNWDFAVGLTQIGNGDILVQVRTADSLADLNGASWSNSFTESGDDNVISEAANKAIQYRLIFQADGGVDSWMCNYSPVLRETPVFDDISITYLPPVQFLFWREE